MKRKEEPTGDSRKKERIDVNELRKTHFEFLVPHKFGRAAALRNVESKDVTMVKGDIIPKSWVVTCHRCDARLNKNKRCKNWMVRNGTMWCSDVTCRRFLITKEEGSDEKDYIYICQECYEESPHWCENCNVSYYEHIKEPKRTYDVIVAEMKDECVVVGCNDCIRDKNPKVSEIIAVRERSGKKKEEEEMGICARCHETFNYATDGITSPFHSKPIHAECSVQCVGCTNQILTKYWTHSLVCMDGSRRAQGCQGGECNICETPSCQKCGISVGKCGLHCIRDGDVYFCAQCK